MSAPPVASDTKDEKAKESATDSPKCGDKRKAANATTAAQSNEDKEESDERKQLQRLSARCNALEKAVEVLAEKLSDLHYSGKDIDGLFLANGLCSECYGAIGDCSCRCRKCGIVDAPCECECFACGSTEPIDCHCTEEEERKEAAKKIKLMEEYLKKTDAKTKNSRPKKPDTKAQ